jgi:hypothetical protein
VSAAGKRVEWPGDKPTGKTRTFSVTVSKTVNMALDESVIAQGLLPDNPIFGSSLTGERAHDETLVLEHLAFNLVGNGLRLGQIDGYSNCPDGSANVTNEPRDVERIEEIKPAHERERGKPR